jgi:pyruvate dehydrogenase E2 component (dihydrolipoamide acetyltransferase)
MTDILMPRFADGMEHGTIVKWLVDDGAPIEAGSELVEIETDKATMTHEADAGGIVNIVAAEGSTIPVGEVIAHIGGERTARSVPPAPAAVVARPGNGNRPRIATPLARRVAAAHDVRLEDLPGSGLGGRITKADVLAAAGLAVEPPPPALAPPPARSDPTPNRGGRIVQPTRLQQIVATRMAMAKATVPHFQVQTEVAFDAALAWRGEFKAVAGKAVAPSVNDVIVRACAVALRDHALLNASFVDGAFELHDQIHVGIAVAAEDGLLVATIRDADIKSIGTLAKESRALVERVRSGTATPAELTGATFTVSNLGMFGMTAITPVINPPQAAILGVGAARPTLARIDGAIVDRQLLTLTLSCDHRVVNGADASRFLADVRDLLETPLRLAL